AARRPRPDRQVEIGFDDLRARDVGKLAPRYRARRVWCWDRDDRPKAEPDEPAQYVGRARRRRGAADDQIYNLEPLTLHGVARAHLASKSVNPGSPTGRGPESMNTGLWNMDSGLAAPPRPGMTAYVVFFVYWAGKRIGRLTAPTRPIRRACSWAARRYLSLPLWLPCSERCWGLRTEYTCIW